MTSFKLIELKRKQTMKAFKELPSNVISWETFKRLVDRNGIERGTSLAMKIIKKLENGKLKCDNASNW